MIDDALYSTLKNNSSVSALVSSRIYPINAPQGATLPLIVFTQIGTLDRELSHSGSTKVCTSHFRLNTIATTPKAAKQIAAAVTKALHGFSGTVGTETIYVARIDSQIDLYDDELINYQVALDLYLTHKEE